MRSAINKLFWGFILIFFNITIGSFDLLPDFIGYILIVNGLGDLKKLNNDEETSQTFNIARILGGIMIAISILSWFIPDQNMSNVYVPSIWAIIFNGVSISIAYSLDYFILKGIAAMLYTLEYEDLADRSKTLKELIIIIGMVAVGFTSFTINFSQRTFIITAAVLVAIVTFIINIYYIYFIRKVYKML